MLVDSDMFVIGQCFCFNKDILLLDGETVKCDHQLKIELIHTIYDLIRLSTSLYKLSNEELTHKKMNRVTIVYVRRQRG